MNQTQQEKNKALVLEAFDTLFNKRDYEKAAKFWSPNYIQHSAHIPPGRGGLFGLVRVMPNSLHYENHLILAEGNDVMLHGRFTGHSSPRPWLAADRLRLEGGLLAEHWDVLADEPTKAESVSGLPAIGDSFASPDQPPTAGLTASSLTVEEARKITAPLYDALNQPAKKDVSALLAQATLPDYRSYQTNEEYRSRDQLAEAFKNLGALVPDLRWTVRDIQVFRDQIVVRGEATGTPNRRILGREIDRQELQNHGDRRFYGAEPQAGVLLSCRELDDGIAADPRVKGVAVPQVVSPDHSGKVDTAAMCLQTSATAEASL